MYLCIHMYLFAVLKMKLFTVLYLQEKPYSFNYSILDEKTGITHSRDESSDDQGVIRGTYEVDTHSLFLSCTNDYLATWHHHTVITVTAGKGFINNVLMFTKTKLHLLLKTSINVNYKFRNFTLRAYSDLATIFRPRQKK